MMVTIRESGQTEINMGTGDVLMVSALTADNHGMVILSNQEPREIGTPNDKFTGMLVDDVYDHPDVQVVMKFTDVRSIDALIGQLSYAKQYMIDESCGEYATKE